MAREEAAPTFETWRHRLEAAQDCGAEVERFLQVLRALGTPMIDGSCGHLRLPRPTGAPRRSGRRVQPMGPHR